MTVLLFKAIGIKLRNKELHHMVLFRIFIYFLFHLLNSKCQVKKLLALLDMPIKITLKF